MCNRVDVHVIMHYHNCSVNVVQYSSHTVTLCTYIHTLQAAITLTNGGVNYDVDLSVWPPADQLSITLALNEHLRKESDSFAEARTAAAASNRTARAECEAAKRALADEKRRGEKDRAAAAAAAKSARRVDYIAEAERAASAVAAAAATSAAAAEALRVERLALSRSRRSVMAMVCAMLEFCQPKGLELVPAATAAAIDVGATAVVAIRSAGAAVKAAGGFNLVSTLLTDDISITSASSAQEGGYRYATAGHSKQQQQPVVRSQQAAAVHATTTTPSQPHKDAPVAVAWSDSSSTSPQRRQSRAAAARSSKASTAAAVAAAAAAIPADVTAALSAARLAEEGCAELERSLLPPPPTFGACSAPSAAAAPPAVTTDSITQGLAQDSAWLGCLMPFLLAKTARADAAFGGDLAQREREIELLLDAQAAMKRSLAALRAAYVDPAQAAVIDALRGRLRATEADTAAMQRRLEVLELSSEVNHGLVETLEGVLDSARDDRRLKTALTLRKLELG
jgi:trimeric autotransporter adhesin